MASRLETQEEGDDEPSLSRFVDKHHPLLRIAPVGGKNAVDVRLTLPPTAAFAAKPVGRWSPEEVLELIQWEVDHLRANPLNGLLSVDDPVVPTMAITPTGDTRLCEGEGPPWTVSCRVSGSKGGPYHVSGGLRVRLLIDSAYPRTPPEVHFMQVSRRLRPQDQRSQPPGCCSHARAARRARRCTTSSWTTTTGCRPSSTSFSRTPATRGGTRCAPRCCSCASCSR